ncbi:ribosomal protein S18 acetylase RimI-like enzyme [Virgibacillus natechei]|uniref:Ribosomal protein S18 acetylase RimI-like enzyme n=1 Tax=Virgibacillus natechei TaxID=1216297 RepID=A0ABS4IHV9_9BACI|nr:GNAT family N-acetyltransferase [Virgibacillus natechei]MBP1970543.1 ribosomal protein S18 acetylase RimI-like enzyme [Virgibacillus natechei]UZD14054.1 GNAT family N-acetyltransferase [Virgibacillus natechei]
MNIVIRKMRKKDVPQVQDVARTSWNATYEGIIPAPIQQNFLNAAYSDKMVKKRLKNTVIYVAEADRKVVGFANFTPGSKEGSVELAALYLFPAYQGKGIGTALLHESMDQLGSREVHLSVEKNNEIGTTFYKAKGFEVVSEFDDDFDGHVLRTVRMVLRV